MPQQEAKPAGPFQLVMVVLSLYVIVALFIESVVKLTPETTAMLQTFDTLICFVFLIDFGIRFAKAESKVKFMKWGWIDFIASIPMMDALRWGRMVRIVRVLRAFRSARVFTTFFLGRRAESALASVVVLSLMLVIFASLAILNLEVEESSNIKTPGDALWWSLTTITTVGYGDRYPVTTEGRIIAVALMIAGAALFSTFTAFIATFFMQAPAQPEKNEELLALVEEVRALRADLERHGITTGPREAERRIGA